MTNLFKIKEPIGLQYNHDLDDVARNHFNIQRHLISRKTMTQF